MAVTLATPSGPVAAMGDESVAAPCVTAKETVANGYAIVPCASSLTTSGRSSGAVARRDCLSPDSRSRRSAGTGVSTRIRWLPESAKNTRPDASTASPCGAFSPATIAGPPSPEKAPVSHFPAIVAMLPSLNRARMQWAVDGLETTASGS